MFLTAELEHLGDFGFTEGLLLRNIKLNSKLNENEEKLWQNFKNTRMHFCLDWKSV